MGRRVLSIVKLFVVMVCVMLSSCSTVSDDTTSKQDNFPVILSGEVSGYPCTRGTKALQETTLSTSVKVGMLAYRDDTGNPQGSSNPYYYDIAEGGVFTQQSTYPNLYYPANGAGLSIYSFIPYNDATSAFSDKTATNTFSVLQDQSNDVNYLASDLLYGSLTGITGPSSIKYTHKLVRIDIVITKGTGVSIDDLRNTSISIVGVKPATTIRLSDGTIGEASGTTENIVAMNIAADAADASEFTASIQVPPQTLSSGEPFLMITFKSTGKSITNKLTGDFKMVGGKYYTCTYEVTTNALSGMSGGLSKFMEVKLSGSATEQ